MVHTVGKFLRTAIVIGLSIQREGNTAAGIEAARDFALGPRNPNRLRGFLCPHGTDQSRVVAQSGVLVVMDKGLGERGGCPHRGSQNVTVRAGHRHGAVLLQRRFVLRIAQLPAAEGVARSGGGIQGIVLPGAQGDFLPVGVGNCPVDGQGMLLPLEIAIQLDSCRLHTASEMVAGVGGIVVCAGHQ